MRIRLCQGAAVAALAFTLLWPLTVRADVAAYWRHEEGVAGADVSPTDPDAVWDSSGNENHMRTYSEVTGATYTTDVPPLPLRSGLPNTLALEFDLDEDGSGPDLNDDNYTELRFIELQLWDEITVEFAFKIETDFIFQALVGKDGMPSPTTPVQTIVAKVRGDSYPNGIPNQLQIEWVDGDGEEQALASGLSIVPDTWYYVAFVLRDDSAELWLTTGAGDYVLVDQTTEQDYAGPAGEVIMNTIAPFTVGRGQYAGNNADWSDATIDEVRISDTALLPAEFLFNATGATDSDGDGVPDLFDECPDTPPGAAVDDVGRPLGDINRDCRTDMQDFQLLQLGFTGP